MPTYQYRCKDCGHELEVVQKFTDDALTQCPSCTGGELRKIFSAVGVVFKGSGFYRTDSRGPEPSSDTNTTKESTTSTGSTTTGSSSTTSSPAPAAAAAAATD